MNRAVKLTRRALLEGGAALGAGLVIGFRLPLDAAAQPAQTTPGVFAPNQWLRIDRDGKHELVTLYQYATGLERLLLLLGLNCGFGQAEIASLQMEEIDLDKKHPYYDLTGSWIRRIRFSRGTLYSFA